MVTALKKHRDTAYHKEKVSILNDTTLSRIDFHSAMVSGKSLDTRIHDAEMQMASFVSEHNLSCHVMDHFSNLLPKLCLDSKVAAHFKSKCTKTKSIIKNALSPYFHDLKNRHFSVIIDETTDVSTCKELAIVTRCYDKELFRVKCQLYELIEVPQADAATLFDAMINSMETDEIPLNNVIGFASDTCNVMFGEHNSAVSDLKENIPNIFVYHMHARNFLELLRNQLELFTTIFLTAQSPRSNLELSSVSVM